MPITAFIRQTPQTNQSYDRWEGYKTSEIYPRPNTEYQRRHYEHVAGPAFAHSGATMGFRAGYESRLEYDRSYSRAYAKFVERMGDRSELGTTLAEYRSAHQMFMQRGTQLLRGWTYLKQGKFRRFLQTFGIKPSKRDRHRRFNRPKQAGGLWLEYWMGWAPTVGDLHASAMVWTGAVNPTTIRAVASSPIKAKDPYGVWTASGKTICLIQADAEVINPNLHLSQQLGLINPAAILLEGGCAEQGNPVTIVNRRSSPVTYVSLVLSLLVRPSWGPTQHPLHHNLLSPLSDFLCKGVLSE